MVSHAVTALVLGAGTSQRFGSDKRMALLPCGMRVLDQTLAHCKEAGLAVLLVLAPGDELLLQHYKKQGTDCLVAASAAQGMAFSLGAGIAAIDPGLPALVVLADMPYVKPSTLVKLANSLEQGAAIVRPVYKGREGNPVGFSPAYFLQLQSLSGDSGARHILGKYRQAIEYCEVDDRGVISDIDYPADIVSS